jgi:hypothetical protein
LNFGTRSHPYGASLYLHTMPFQILLADRVEQINTTRFEMTGVNDARLVVHHRREGSSHIYRRIVCHSRRIRYSSQLRAWAVRRRGKGVLIKSAK